MGVGAVLPLGAVLPPLLPPLVPQNPTRKTSFSNRGGSSPEALRYYDRRPQAVLPLGSGTTALGAVLPLGCFGGTTAVDRGTTAGAGQSILGEKGQLQ